MRHVLVETNWVVGVASPSHHRMRDALQLLVMAANGEVTIEVPAFCFAEDQTQSTTPRSGRHSNLPRVGKAHRNSESGQRRLLASRASSSARWTKTCSRGVATVPTSQRFARSTTIMPSPWKPRSRSNAGAGSVTDLVRAHLQRVQAVPGDRSVRARPVARDVTGRGRQIRESRPGEREGAPNCGGFVGHRRQ